MTDSTLTRRLFLAGLAASFGAACGSSNSNPNQPSQPVTWVTDLSFTIIDLEEGTGAEAQNGSRVVVDYVGWLYSTASSDNNKGAVFDTSLQAGRTPFQYVVGTGAVIAGWERGVPGMKVGGIRRLILPPDLAYGASGSGTIPPNATLIFEIRLNDILVSAT